MMILNKPTHVEDVRKVMNGAFVNTVGENAGKPATTTVIALGTEVHVGRIDLGYIKRFVLDDILIYDQRHKKMLSASRVGARVDIWHLLRTGEINISSARKPKSCAEEILISPVRKRCQMSTLAPTRDADNIFL